jgi:hypothetical protein
MVRDRPVAPATQPPREADMWRVAAALLVALTACSDATAPEVEESHLGTYNLVTVNGVPLPFSVWQNGDDRLDVTAASITLNEDLSFDDRMTFRLREGGIEEVEEDVSVGSYTLSRGTLQFTSQWGGRYAAAHDGRTITQIFETVVLIYRK